MIVGFSNSDSEFSLDIEKVFAVIALLFYSELLAFQSAFALSEGDGTTLFPEASYNPLTPLLRLTQHGIFILTLGLLILRWRQTLRVSTQGLFIWGLLLLVMASFLWSDTPAVTQRGTLSLLETTLFGLYFAARFSRREQLNLLAVCGSLFALTSLLFSLALPSFAIEAGVHAGDWRGPLIQKNLFARSLVLFAIASYIHQPKQLLGKSIRALTLLLCILLVVLSASKTGIVILILMLGLIESQKFFYKLFIQLPMAFIPVICAALLSAMATLVTAASNAQGIVNLTGRDLSLSGRTEIWSALITKISERPLLGYGYQGFWRGIYGESAYIGKVFDNTYLPPHSHNGFFELTLAFGLLGLILFALSFLLNARFALRLPIATFEPTALWPLTYLTFIVLYNQTESTLVAHNSIFWTLYIALTFSKAPTATPQAPPEKKRSPKTTTPQLCQPLAKSTTIKPASPTFRGVWGRQCGPQAAQLATQQRRGLGRKSPFLTLN